MVPRLVLIGFLISSGCTTAKMDQGASDSTKTLRPIAQVLADSTAGWLKIPGVTGTGETSQTDGKPAIMIMVENLTDSLRSKLPKSVEGYPVIIEQTGTIKAFKQQ